MAQILTSIEAPIGSSPVGARRVSRPSSYSRTLFSWRAEGPAEGLTCSASRVASPRAEIGPPSRPLPVRRRFEIPFDLVRLADDLGFHSVWTAEAYGSDALTPLAAIARGHRHASSSGTAVVQLAGRPPATSAMQAMTIDALAGGGRMIIGIGVSGPADRRRVVRPTVGQAERPAARLRGDPPRRCSAREGPVTHDGPEISLPYTGSGRARAGQAAQVDPARAVRHPDLAGVGRSAQHRAVRGAVRWLAADGAAARGHRRPRRRRACSTRASPARGRRAGAATTSTSSTGSP